MYPEQALDTKKNSASLKGLFVYLSLCLFIYYFCFPAMRPGERRTTGARVNPMDICNLSFIRHWWQAGPKYGTVNTNHRSFTDTDTHRQALTHTNTHPCACTYLKCIFEDRCFYAFTELDTGHTTTCFLQRGVDIFFFPSPSALSLSLFWERSSPSFTSISPCWFLAGQTLKSVVPPPSY